MAIRSRLKALAKKMIFGSSSTSSPTPPTPPVKSSPSFQQTPVKTEAAMDPPKTTEKTPAPTTNDAVSPSEELNVETPVEESQAASETSNLDPNEASYVFDIVDLFPAFARIAEHLVQIIGFGSRTSLRVDLAKLPTQIDPNILQSKRESETLQGFIKYL